MAIYENILLAVDFNPGDDDPITLRAMGIAECTKGKLSVIHVIEYPYNYGAPYEIPTMIEWQEEIEKSAKKQLVEFGAKLGIPPERQHLQVGVPKNIILDVAEKIQADLIILGSHGRHGLNLLLLGSTANGVLHGAKCDVLAVRIEEAGKK